MAKNGNHLENNSKPKLPRGPAAAQRISCAGVIEADEIFAPNKPMLILDMGILQHNKANRWQHS